METFAGPSACGAVLFLTRMPRHAAGGIGPPPHAAGGGPNREGADREQDGEELARDIKGV